MSGIMSNPITTALSSRKQQLLAARCIRAFRAVSLCIVWPLGFLLFPDDVPATKPNDSTEGGPDGHRYSEFFQSQEEKDKHGHDGKDS